MNRRLSSVKALSPGRSWPVLVALILALLLPLGVVACSTGTASTTDSSAAAVVATTAGTASAELAAANGTNAAPQTLENVTTEIVSPAEVVAAQVSASVVNVRVAGVTVSPFYGQERYEGVGSGIIYSSDGYILTNDHVVSLNGQAVDSVEVTFSTGETMPATIVARDAANDVALLKVGKTGLVPVSFADWSGVAVGQWAIAIGSPLDYRNSVTVGIVSGLDRDLDTGDSASSQLTGLLQTDAAISPGNSGGGLFNAAGDLIGMPEAYVSPSSGAENIGFAIPADKLASIATQLMAKQ
jgi:S1-C subfamily serine protease